MLNPLILDIREVTNLVLLILGMVMSALFISYIWDRWWINGSGGGRPYIALDRTVKAAIGFSILMAGEMLRAAVIWELLHFERGESNYGSRAPILIFALFLIILGSICVIRVFTPPPLGHWLWIGSVIVALGAAYISVAFY